MRVWGWVVTGFLLLAAGSGLRAQTAAGSAAQVIGEVVSLDAASRQLTVRTDAGETVVLAVRENAPVLRVPPGSKDLKSAPRIQLSEITAGDRVAATAHRLPGKTEAGSVIVMSHGDIAAARSREQQEWQKRGSGGIVTSVDSSTGTFTIKAGQKTVTVRPKPGAEFRRYAQESVKFADARPSSPADIHPGDQVRVLGDRSEDGASIAAERVVSGSFRQIAGTVSSVDPAAGEIRITDLATKKPLTVAVNSDTTMKKLPAMAATMLARRLQGGAAPAQAQGGRGPADVNQMLDRLPAMPLSELKPGDAVMLSTTAGDASRATAVMLLAGVEPLLTGSPTVTRDLMGGWMSGGGEGEGAGQ